MKGNVPIPGLGFTDSVAPVETDSSMHMIFALSLHKWDMSGDKMGVRSLFDVEAAFLGGQMDEDKSIVMGQMGL